MNPYIGHDSQIRGVEELRLISGKKDGMRIYKKENKYKIAVKIRFSEKKVCQSV